MASIQKLSVRGIRSFSPEDSEQVLEFYMPLTVIVGANGCGKTTIIESLKFAVCGAMPPGNKSGQAFVHDPRSIGTSVVKASVKLRFANQAGQTMVVVRSMEVQQKKASLSFKQLDGVIRTATGGQKKSMSHKCTELDRQVPLMLGVSKAILENVVFCHQEESSWPLQEGAVLKKKFDDIFDSTRYTKALDVFSKLKKEYTLTAKDLKANAMELKSHKHAAQGFQREIEKYNEQLEELEENLKSGRKALAENEAERERLSALQEQLYTIEHKVGMKKQALITEKTAISRQRDMLERDMTDDKSLEELQKMLQSFDAEFEGHRDKKHNVEKKMKEIARETDKLRDEKTKLQSQIGRLEAAKETHEKNLLARYEKMVEIGTQFGLADVITQISQNSQGTTVAASQDTSFVSAAYGSLDNSVLGSPNSSLLQSQQRPILNISADDLNEYSRALKRKQEQLQEEQTKLRRQRKAQEEQFNSEISELKGKLNVLESNKRRIEDEKEDIAEELKEIGDKSSRVPRMREDTVKEAKAKAADASKKRDEANTNPRRKQIPTEIGSLRNKMDGVQQSLEKDKEVQEELMEFQKDEAEINEAKISADSEFETLQEEIKESVDVQQFRLFGLDPPPKALPKRENDISGEELQALVRKVRDGIKDKMDEKKSDAEKVNGTVQSLTEKKHNAAALLGQDKNSIGGVKARMGQLQDKVDQYAQVVQKVRTFERNRDRESDESPFKPEEADPQALLDYLQERLDAIESESTQGVAVGVLKKVMKSLRKHALSSHKCPCCKKKLETQKETEKLTKALDVLMSDSSPLALMDDATKLAKENLTQWYDEVKSNLSEVAEFFRLKKEAELLETRKADREKALVTLETELKQANGEAEELNNDLETSREMHDSWRRWSEAAGRIAGFRAKVASREESIRKATSDKRDLKQVNSDIGKLEKQKDEYIAKMNALNKEMTEINDDMSNHAQAATRLEQFYRDMQAKYDEELKLGERKKTLKEKEKSLKKEVDKLSDQIEKAKQPIEEKERDKSKSLSSMEHDEENLSESFMQFTTNTQDYNRIVSLIEDYEAATKGKDVSDLLEQSDDFSTKIEGKSKEYAALKPELDSLAKIVDDQDRERNIVEDNMKLLQAQEKVKVLEKDIAALAGDLSEVEGGETVDDDLAQLDERKSQFIADNARLEGRRSEVVESIRGLKRKLSQPEYRNVEEQYHVANVKFDTSEMAVKDIEKYHSALDKALQRYHGLKIGEINNIIRDLWALTYKGEDINTIRIVSGQDSGSRSSRSYNYRVVMEKGGSEMDMRGRCSAGQRVLASIVIRLALAETFCVAFGCIALDEPTVNLDYNNKKGLAVALAQIIASRQAQSNFQLVLITHDEDFVVMMKNELATQTNVSMPEKYFQIRREEGSDGKFYSKIDAVDWEELL